MFKRDPHIRFHADPPPLVPGSQDRFTWPCEWDEDVQLLRDGMQESGKGLYVLRFRSGKIVAEAYYPEDVRAAYFAEQLDPVRQSDYRCGRLVVVGYPLTMPNGRPRYIGDDGISSILTVLRRGNRNARRELRRSYNPQQWRLELDDVKDAEYQKADDATGFSGSYVDAWKETRRIITPHSYGGL